MLYLTNNSFSFSAQKLVRRGLILGIIGFLNFIAIYHSVSAEVDPTILMNILSQIAGTGTVQNNNMITTSTGSGTVGTTPTVIPSTGTDHLMIMINPTGRVGESMDITIKALTKNETIATDYRGTIFISVDNDYKAKVPYPDGYSFTSQDQGIRTFSKGLSFSKAGNFQVSVSDFSQGKIMGSTHVVISTAATATPKTDPPILSTSTNTDKKVQIVSNTSPVFKIKKVETGDKKATITFQVLNETADIEKFIFLYADAVGNSRKVMTFPKERLKNSNGDYVWYIPNLDLTKYVISIAGADKNGENIAGVISQPFEANLSLLSAGKCIIPNVSGLRVLSKKDTSVLYWDSIPEAMVYKVYKKDINGEYVFLQETKQDSYTVHVADGSIKYEDFSVKAVCSDGTESTSFAPDTRVRTGPKEIVILMIVSALAGLLIMVIKRKLG